MARIALVVPALAESGGVGSVAAFVRRTIARRPDFEVKLISLSMSSSDPCSRLLLRPASWRRGVSTRRGTFDGEPFIHVGAEMGEIETQRLKPRRALSNLIEDCDLIQVVAGVPSWALPAIGLGKPVVLQCATLVAVERRRRMAGSRGVIDIWRAAMTSRVSRLDAEAIMSVQAILVENDWMLSHAKAVALSGTLVRRAPPGIAMDVFFPCEQRDLGRGYILTVGRLGDPRKNVDLLLDAYARLCGKLPDAPPLILAGFGGPGPSFWARVEALGLSHRVSFHEKPSIGELADLYRNALAFALSSDEEGFGVVVVEAMASGVPVVSTRSGGPDGIITDKDDGFLVDRDDSAAFSDRLYSLCSDLALNAEMGRRARLTAERFYSEDAAGDVYLRVYDQLLGRQPDE